MTLETSRRKLMIGAAGAAAAAITATTNQALGKAANEKFRTVSYVRKLGDLEVTTLLDGYFMFQQEWIKGLTPEEIAKSLEKVHFDPKSAFPLPVAAHLVRQGDKLTLMDSGVGSILGPTAGKLVGMLDNIGVKPDDISRIFVSHMHPDHIGSMFSDGKAVYNNASVHVSATDFTFWTDETNAAKAPDVVKPWYELARNVAKSYGDRIKTFDGEKDLGEGVSSVPLPGHTLGHTGFRISSGKDQLLLWGDSTALASMQFSHPQTGIVFDMDSDLAEKTRRKLLDMVTTDRMLVAGTHMPFPGFGYVDKRAEAYAWVPEEWQVQ